MGQSSNVGAIDSWKQPGFKPHAQESKTPRRLFFTASFLLLMGLLIWVLLSMLWTRPTLLVSLPIDHHSDLGVPPVSYWAEDTRAFLDIGHDSASELANLDTYAAISTLEDRLRAEVSHAGGLWWPRLILQVTGQGVSDDGEAWLLCSDFSPRRQENRYKVADLLRAVSKAPAQRKIVILDASHILSDPRLGMLINEFPRLLEEEVHRIPDPDLWVLASCSQGEVSQACGSEKRTLFGGLVTQGLRGAADANGDGWVDLDELFHYVRSNAAAWAQAAGEPTQTPVLLRGGEGIVSPPTGISLRPISESGRGAAEPSAAKDSGKDSAIAKAPLPDNAAGETAAAREDAYLAKIWQLHDSIQNRGGNAWTPVDYAPHLWRQWQAQLLAFERICRAGSGYDDQLAGKGNAYCRAMTNWSARQGAGEPDASALLGELQKARGRFEPVAAAHDNLPKELQAAIQLRNDLAYQAPYYVRWHAGTLRLSATRHRLYPEIVRLLDEVRIFSDELDKIGTSGQAATDRPPYLAADFVRREQALRDLAKNLQDGVRGEAGECIAAAENGKTENEKTPRPYGLAARMDALLATPLAPAELRAKLFNARDKLDLRLPKPAKAAELADRSPASPIKLGPRLRDQAELEYRLANLAVTKSPLDLPAEKISWEEGPSQDEAWRTYRKFGHELEAFYRSLPAGSDRLNSSDKSADWRRSNCSLRLIDARDAALVQNRLFHPELPAGLALPPQVLVNGLPAELTLNLDRPGSLQLEVQLKNATAQEAELRIDYDAAQLEILRKDDSQALPPQTPLALHLKQNTTTESFIIKPRQPSGKTVTATFEVSCPGDRSSAETSCKASEVVRCKLPAPDVFELVARRVGGHKEYRSDNDTIPLILRPFPNRQTRYRFELVNRSGREKRLALDWYAVAKLGSQYPASLNELIEHDEPRAGIEKLGHMELTAPDDEKKPLPIVFPDVKPAGGASPGTPISGGVACVIYDAASKECKGLRWVRFVPLTPAEYVSRSVSYVAQKGRIEVRVKVAPDADFPPLNEKNTIQVGMEIDPPPVAGLKNHAELVADDTPAFLFAEVKPDLHQSEAVRLTIDDYPRALLYEVNCERRDHLDVPPKRDESAIRIVQPSPEQAYCTPLAKPVPALIQVDAPEVAFRDLRGSSSDQVTLRVFDAEQRQELCPESRFYTDRTISIKYEGGSEGSFPVFAKVGDFEVPLSLGGLSNQRIILRADLLLTTKLAEDLRHKSSSVPIVLDGQKPKFTLGGEGPFRRGQESIKVTARVLPPLSGVEKVEFGFQGKKAAEFAPAPEPVAGRPGDDNTWSAELPTADLKPGVYPVLVWVTSKAGLKDWSTISVRVEDPPAAPPGPSTLPPAKKLSAIDGVVVWRDGGKAVAGMAVSVRGHPEFGSPTTQGDGKFRFQDMPADKYEIEATGTPIGYKVWGREEVTAPGAIDPIPVTIKIH